MENNSKFFHLLVYAIPYWYQFLRVLIFEMIEMTLFCGYIISRISLEMLQNSPNCLTMIDFSKEKLMRYKLSQTLYKTAKSEEINTNKVARFFVPDCDKVNCTFLPSSFALCG